MALSEAHIYTIACVNITYLKNKACFISGQTQDWDVLCRDEMTCWTGDLSWSLQIRPLLQHSSETEATVGKMLMTACLEFVKLHLKDKVQRDLLICWDTNWRPGTDHHSVNPLVQLSTVEASSCCRGASQQHKQRDLSGFTFQYLRDLE